MSVVEEPGVYKYLSLVSSHRQRLSTASLSQYESERRGNNIARLGAGWYGLDVRGKGIDGAKD
jgi:hypothetical protein